MRSCGQRRSHGLTDTMRFLAALSPAICTRRELREGSRRSCEQRQSHRLTDAAIEAANASKLAATRKHVLAMHRHEHVGKQQQYSSDLQVGTHLGGFLCALFFGEGGCLHIRGFSKAGNKKQRACTSAGQACAGRRRGLVKRNNALKLAATRKHVLAMHLHEHVGKQQQHDSDL